MDGNSRNCLPRAADGVHHISRAKFSEIITTGRSPYTSLHVNSRPAIDRDPAVCRKPGEIYLYNRSGAISLSGYVLSWAKMQSQSEPKPSIGISLTSPADFTPGVAASFSRIWF